MKVDAKLIYKSETGLSPYFNIEAERLTKELDSEIMRDMDGEEIRDININLSEK